MLGCLGKAPPDRLVHCVRLHDPTQQAEYAVQEVLLSPQNWGRNMMNVLNVLNNPLTQFCMVEGKGKFSEIFTIMTF